MSRSHPPHLLVVFRPLARSVAVPRSGVRRHMLPPMRSRPTAPELERSAAAEPAPAVAPAPGPGEALAMLVRRGLRPRLGPVDLPFAPNLDGPAADRLAERLGHYAFRLFLRGAILRRGPFSPPQATRFVTPVQARRLAEQMLELGLAERAPRGRFRLVHPARSFGGTLEWYLARELRRRLGLDLAAGVRSGAAGVGGDLDIVAAAEGKLLYLEVKSSPPKHLTRAEVAAFLRRVRGLRPDLALFVVDTALRLSDKVLPMLREALGPGLQARPRRIVRETWAVAPGLYAVNAKQDLMENVCRAIADGLLARSPPPP